MAPSQRGLTLPELLIALLVFSMVSAAGVAGLRLAIEGREQFEIADARLRQWQTFEATLRDDLANVVPRIARDQFGTPSAAAFVGGRALELSRAAPVDGEAPLFAFVRGGRANPGAREPRSTLQHVEYLVRGDAIFRRARPYVDAAPNATAFERRVLEGLTVAEASFLLGQTTQGFDWAEAWPAVAGAARPPLAVRLVLATARFGELEILFWIGTVSA